MTKVNRKINTGEIWEKNIQKVITLFFYYSYIKRNRSYCSPERHEKLKLKLHKWLNLSLTGFNINKNASVDF